MSSTYVDGTTPLDAAHMNALQQKVEKGQANGYASLDGTTKVPVAQIPLTVVSYGTTLPASPVDGQEAILVDSLTNPTYQWRFRYNAGSTSPYKWEFVGGSTLSAYVAAAEYRSAGGYGDLQTVGPRVQLVRAGDYEAFAYMNVAKGATAVAFTALAHLLLETQATTSPDCNFSGMGNASGQTSIRMTNEWNRLTTQAGEFLKLVYATNITSADISIGARLLTVRPIRVS
jgi:hypothetical protein